jgi:hypothetical protein
MKHFKLHSLEAFDILMFAHTWWMIMSQTEIFMAVVTGSTACMHTSKLNGPLLLVD